MKIRILSDLHIEFESFEVDFSDCDLIVLAGGVHVKDKGIKWIEAQLTNKAVLYILGNHEFYGKAYPKLINDLKEQTKNSNIHVLEKEKVGCLSILKSQSFVSVLPAAGTPAMRETTDNASDESVDVGGTTCNILRRDSNEHPDF